MRLRFAREPDFPAVLGLNHASVQFLSPLTPQRLAHLHAQAELHLVLEAEGASPRDSASSAQPRHEADPGPGGAQAGGEVVAFLLAFREGADYDSVNYRWFAQRYDRFLYVDRVVVAARAQGQGAASRLYDEVFAQARGQAVPVVTCEFDIDPPNPVSERFHAKFGFREVGRQAVPYAPKQVSLQAAPVM